MTRPRYYRARVTPVLWGVGVALAIALGLWFAHRQQMAWARADERARVLREGDALLQQALARGAALARERDSLRVLVAQVDTVLVTRLRTIRDTAWMPADTTPVVVLAACRAQLDTLAQDCDTFRRAATTALAQADTIQRRDSAAIAGLSLQLAGIRRADSVRATQQARRARVRLATDAVCVGAVAAHLFQWSTR